VHKPLRYETRDLAIGFIGWQQSGPSRGQPASPRSTRRSQSQITTPVSSAASEGFASRWSVLNRTLPTTTTSSTLQTRPLELACWQYR
jgi:hypothetical protein